MLPLHAGFDHGSLWGAWSADWLLVAAGVWLAAVAYLAGWARLRRRGRSDLAGVWRAVAFLAGLAVLLLALVSPLDEVGERYLLSAHMAQHLLIGDIAPILLVVGLAGPLVLFAVPRPALRGIARAPALRRALGVLARPLTAFLVWTAVMVGWHVPAVYELALEHRWAHDLEHLSMVVAGLLVWATVLGLTPRRSMSPGRRAGFAAAVFLVGLVVSQTLLLSDPLYGVYVEQTHRLFGLTPAGDQTRAALLMGTEQLMTLGLAAGVLAWTHLERVAAQVSLERGPGTGPRRTG